jgi:hypothetical protein
MSFYALKYAERKANESQLNSNLRVIFTKNTFLKFLMFISGSQT